MYGFTIRELGFGEDYAHVHFIVNVPFKYSIEDTLEILKSHTSSRIFQEIPNFEKRYPNRTFWSGWKYSGSVGPVTEETVKNYIRRQDVSQQRLTDFS